MALSLVLAACSSPEGSTDPVAYPRCDSIQTTPGALADKAARFDELTQTLHIPPGQDQIHTVFLQEDLQTLERVKVADNEGLWTSLYAASQAFRYAATGSDEALDNLRRALRASRDLLRITGGPGLFARAYVNPALPGYPTEQELYDQYPDCELDKQHCKRWNLVEEGEYAGYLFKNDVSKDEYVGHMFVIGVIAALIDDPDVRATGSEIAAAVADHLIANSLQIIDIDGERTTHGHIGAFGGDDFPGFNAVLALSWMRVAASATGEARFADFYADCLLQTNPGACVAQDVLTPNPYPSYIEAVALDLGCSSNWSNHNMIQLSTFNLLRLETDDELRASLQESYRQHIWDTRSTYSMSKQANSLFTFFWEVNRGADTSFPEAELDAAICTLKRYPAEKYRRAVDTTGYPQVCTDRHGRPMSDVLVSIDERESDNFQWTKNPYTIAQVDEDRARIESPEDYLLAYWVGRYYGIISAAL